MIVPKYEAVIHTLAVDVDDRELLADCESPMLADTVAVGDEGTENDEPPDMVARDPETPLDGVNLMESVERMEPDTEYEVECVADDELLEDVVGESETVWHEETVTV